MKKYIALLMVLVLALGLAAVGSAWADGGDAAPSSSGAVPKFDVDIPESADAQVTLLFQQFDSFRQDDSSTPWSYVVTDLDHDGQLELLAATIVGAGRFTSVKAWEVKADNSGADEIAVPVNQGDSFPDIIIDAADSFCDRSSGQWYYMFFDQVTVSTQEVYANKSAISLTDGTLKFFTYAYQHNEWTNGRMVTTFTDAQGQIITPEEYNAVGDNVFSAMEHSTVHLDWFHAGEAVNAGRFADSYAVFLGLKQPPKPDAPAPAMTPQPDTPSSFLLITKNPTDEYHNQGETAWFVANADNWSNATWTFVSPYGGECSWQSFRNQFAYCDVSGGDSGTVSISNTDPGMTGWGAYCTFYGNGQTARSTTAYLTIYANPQPPTPVPPPVPTYPQYNQMDGVVVDYLMSTITIALDNGMTVTPIKDICNIMGQLNYGDAATVYYTGDYPDSDSIYAVDIYGDDPPAPVDNSMGATFRGATMSGANFALDNGESVTVSSDICSNLGQVTFGDSATVYFYGDYPTEDNIYHVDIYGRLKDGDSGDTPILYQPNFQDPGDFDAPWLLGAN